MDRRKFLKLLGAIPLTLGLRLPIAEPELEPVWEGNIERITLAEWEGYVERVTLIDNDLDEPIDSPFGWWFVDSNGEKWKSVNEGATWYKIVCQDIGRVKYADT